MTTSEKICIAALEYQTGPFGRQCLTATGGGARQKSDTGMQKTKPLVTIHRPAMTRKPMRAYVMNMKGFERKMRRKRNRAESLERIRARL